MEILDPNTRSCTFLTLTKYVGEKNKVEPAVCSLRKDEAFLDSTNCFVAAESWRLSCAPNPYGIVYHWIPNTYYISCEQNITESDHTAAQHAIPLIANPNINGGIKFIDILTDEEAMPDKQQFTIRPVAPDDHKENEIDVNDIAVTMLGMMNPFMVTKNSKITLQNANNDAGYYIIQDDPLAKLQGPGFGPSGLVPLRGTFRYNISDSTAAPSTNTGQCRFMQFLIPNALVPGISQHQIKHFFSHGVAFWRDSTKTAVTGTLPYLTVYGPVLMQTDVATFSANVGGGNQLFPAESPIVQLFCKQGIFQVGNTVFHQELDNQNIIVEKHAVITHCNEWVMKTQGGDWMVHLAVQLTQEGATNAQGAAIHGVVAGGLYDYYAYSNKIHDPRHDIYQLIQSVCVIGAHGEDDEKDPDADIAPPNSDDSTLPKLVKARTYRRSVRRQATTGSQPIPSYTPNDFMQYFNVGFGDQEQPYVLCTSPNGGWRIVILSDNISKFVISKPMADEMGLLDYMITDGIESTKVTGQEKIPMIIEIAPDKRGANWLWNWVEDYGHPTSMMSRLETGDVTDFNIVSAVDGAVYGRLAEGDNAPQHIQNIETRKYYRLVAFEKSTLVETTVSSVQHKAQTIIDSTGVEYYQFLNPAKGSYIENDQQVSIGSFSIFEAIRLVVPSGISFDPMISSHADARILCELRLPFQNTAEIQQGFLENKPLVTSTESAFYGDIIWNNPPSGLQYLPLTTQGGIYDFEIAAELIYRDPDIPPQRVMLGYTDIFQVKLRFINRN
jgi:hypothetical protein